MNMISRWAHRNPHVFAFMVFGTIAAVMASCTSITLPPTDGGGGGGSVTVIQQVDSGNTGATATPIPGTAGSSGIYKVKAGFYGGRCGATPMTPGQTELVVGCEGDMTATPKVLIAGGGSDRDATEAEHGPDSEVRWTSTGDGVLQCVTTFSNGFNRACKALAVGSWQQCATVKGVQGCASGTVK